MSIERNLSAAGEMLEGHLYVADARGESIWSSVSRANFKSNILDGEEPTGWGYLQNIRFLPSPLSISPSPTIVREKDSLSVCSNPIIFPSVFCVISLFYSALEILGLSVLFWHVFLGWKSVLEASVHIDDFYYVMF